MTYVYYLSFFLYIFIIFFSHSEFFLLRLASGLFYPQIEGVEDLRITGYISTYSRFRINTPSLQSNI